MFCWFFGKSKVIKKDILKLIDFDNTNSTSESFKHSLHLWKVQKFPWQFRDRCHLGCSSICKRHSKMHYHAISICIWLFYLKQTQLFLFQKYRKNVRNGIFFPKLFWPTVRKNCSIYLVIYKQIWDYWINLFEQWKVSAIFEKRILF